MGHPARALGSKCKRKGQCHDGVSQENPRVAPSGGGWLAAGGHTYLLEVTLGPRLQLMNTQHRHQGAAAGRDRGEYCGSG